jgi:SAM-dependent methyltransferase
MTPDLTRLSVAAWSAGIEPEAAFWENWTKTGGGRWPDDFVARLRAGRQFDTGLESLLPKGGTVRVLDVGAGPMTVLGVASSERTIQILAVDPLADLYQHILTTYDIAPPIPTVFATAEDLSAFFGPSTFDLVHCQNALDHSFDPFCGIEEMLRVVKTGGHVVLRHYINEAEYEDYAGFHQFNFDMKDGRFHIWNRSSGIFPDEYVHCETIFTTSANRPARSVQVVIRKTGEFADMSDGGRFRQRVCDLTKGLINHFVSLSIDKLRRPDAGFPR